MRRLYSLLLYLLLPLVLLYLLFRGFRDRRYLSRWAERVGFLSAPAETGGIVVHAVSMGEVNAASVLIRGLAAAYPDTPICVTAFTPTGSNRIRELFDDSVFHVYSPLDLPGAVSRFFDRVRPRMLVIMETEIWPNLYHHAASRNIPIMVANARISDQSLQSYQRFHRLTAGALENVDCIAAQSEQDGDRLRTIGANPAHVHVTGNLKFDLTLPSSLHEEGDSIRLAWGSHRPVLVAGSTHEKEEAVVVRAFKRLLGRFPDALLVLVPRHPERFSRAAHSARSSGLQVSLRSESPVCPPQTQCFVIDAMGELQSYYAAGDVAFVGGSLEPIGGHNPLEPAALSKPVLFGPHMFNFADISRQLLESGAAIEVTDGEKLEAQVTRLFQDPILRDDMGRAAHQLFKNGQGAVDRTLFLLEKVLTREAG